MRQAASTLTAGSHLCRARPAALGTGADFQQSEFESAGHGLGAVGGFTPLAKTLLWQGDFGTSNFEGMTFGPTLADGWTSLLLVSDNGGGIRQDLYALAVVPEPSTWVLGAMGIACAAWGALQRGRL